MNTRTKAILWLTAATASWGLSFPLHKTLLETAADQGPADYLTAWTIAVRFGIASLILILTGWMSRPTTLEWRQGLWLGILAAGGMFTQAYGLKFTAASTSAFLTNLTCVLIPLWASVTTRRLPQRRILLAVTAVLLGVALISGLHPGNLHLGKGEWLTITCAVFFSAEMLLLESQRFATNRSAIVSIIMFTTLALICGGLAWLLAPSGAPAWPVKTIGGHALLAVLTLSCTLFSFTAMNHWQPRVTATEAGVIYCTEPVFTSIYVLFLPALLTAWTAVQYHNETFTTSTLIGGALIVGANLFLQITHPAPPLPASHEKTPVPPV